MFKNIKYKEPLFHTSWLLVFLFLMGGAMQAQQYKWAVNNGTVAPVNAGGAMSVRSDGVVSISFNTVGAGSRTYSVGAGDNTTWTQQFNSVGFDTNLDDHARNDGNGPNAQDPLNANIRYVSTVIQSNTISTAGYNGWNFNFSNNDGIAVAIAKQTWNGSSWITNWVRFINKPNSINYNGVRELYSVDAVNFGGITKVLVTFKSSNPTSEEIGVYSNGVLTNVVTDANNAAHLILKSSNTAINNAFVYGVAQFEGTNGTPEFLGTIADYTGSYKAGKIFAKYEPTGKMILFPLLNQGTASATLAYKNYTDNVGTPVSNYPLGAFSNAANRYALLKLDTDIATAGNVLKAYTTNVSDPLGTKTNFSANYIETDADNVYIIGNRSGSITTYDAQGTAGIVTTNSTNVLVVKVAHTAAVMQPIAVNKYGDYGYFSFSNSNYSQTALDRINGKLYFNIRINNPFTQNGATVLVNPSVGAGGSTVMQINTSDLTAANAINLLGNSPNAAVNTNNIQVIKAIGVNPTNGELYLVGDINNSGLLKVNNTTVKTINYYNGVIPAVGNSSDVFVIKLDHTLNTITPSGSTFSNVFARSSNDVVSATKNAGGNIIYAANFFGEFVTPAGILNTINFKIGCLLEVNPTTGNILKAIQSTDDRQGFSIRKIIFNPFDNFIYVLSSNNDGNWNGGVVRPIGNNAPLITINKGSLNASYLTKIDPANFNHVWTSIIAQNNPIATNPLGGTMFLSDIDYDNTNGEVYVVGRHGATDLLVSTQGVSAANTFTFGNGVTPSSNFSFVARTVNLGIGQSVDFMVKIKSDGTFQYGATFGTINGGMNDNNQSPKISFLNNKTYISVYPTSNSPFHFNVQGSTGAGTSIFTAVANRTYLMALDAAAPALPTAIRDFSAFNSLKNRVIVSDKLNNRLYLGHEYGNTVSLSGTTQTSSGSWDILIHEIAQNTMADVNTGNIKIGGSGEELLNEIKVDDTGKLFYIGTSSSSTPFNITTPGGTVTTSPLSGVRDYLVGGVDVDSLYKPLFAFVSGSVFDDTARCITPGNIGSIFVGGDLKGQATFGTQTILANPSGDLLFGRIDYPYKGPGGINSGLDNWFDAKYEVTQSGANVTMIENKNKLTPPDVNPNFPSVTNTGTIPYNVPTATEVRANFAPSFTTSTGNVLENTGITSNLFANQGKSTTIFMVAKPTDATSELMNWTETTNNSRVNINASNTVFTNATAGTKTTTNTAVVPANKWSLVTMNVTPAGAITNGLNGKSNGTNTGAGVLDTANAGTFTIGGGASTEIAEMATYSNSYVLSSNQFGQIASYFCLKYGVTLDNSLPYRSSRGSIQYDHRTTGPEFNFRYDVAGLARDDYAFLDKRQTVSANSNLITLGAGNQIQIENSLNTAALSDGEYILFGSDTAANAIGGSKIGSIPPNFAICEGYNLEKTWRVKVSLPYAQRSADLKKTKVTIKLSEAGMDITKNANPSNASSYYLMIDRNDNGVYSDAVDQSYTGTTLTQVGGVDEFVTFENVEFDTDSSGSDQFAIVWRSNGGNAAVYAPVGTSGNLINPCTNNGFKYYRDPADQEQSYAIYNPNGNTFVDTAIKVTRAASILNSDLYQSPTTVNRKAALMPYFISHVDATNYTLNGGVTLRFFYNPADKDAVDALYTANNSWVHYPGTAAAFQTAFTTTPNCYTFLTPVSSGLTVNGLGFVDLKIPSGGTVGYLAYQDWPGLTSCKIIYGTDPNAQIAGTQLFAHDNVLTFQLNNTTGGVATVSGLTPLTIGHVNYDTVGKKWYVWDGTNWYPIDNVANKNPGPTTNGTSEGKIIFYQGHVWGWDGTSWKQLDNQ